MSWLDPSLTHQTTKQENETTQKLKTQARQHQVIKKSSLKENPSYHPVLPPRLVWHVMQREKQSKHEQGSHCAGQSIMWAFYILSPFLHVGTSSDTRLKFGLLCWILVRASGQLFFFAVHLARWKTQASTSSGGGFDPPTHYSPSNQINTYKKCVNIPSSS